MRNSILITGANRGLGLEFVRQYLESGWRVVATYRDEREKLEQLGNDYNDQLVISRLALTDYASYDDFVARLPSDGLDVVLHNAGVFLESECEWLESTPQMWHECFQVNTIAPFFLTKALLPLVLKRPRKLFLFMSSLLGSIGENNSGNYYIYRSSKAALNMCVKGLSVDLASQGVTTVALHPGWVKTDMGGSDAIYEVNDSVSSLIKVIEKCDLSRSGGFYSWQDQRLSW